jgi:hypothetical protein
MKVVAERLGDTPGQAAVEIRIVNKEEHGDLVKVTVSPWSENDVVTVGRFPLSGMQALRTMEGKELHDEKMVMFYINSNDCIGFGCRTTNGYVKYAISSEQYEPVLDRLAEEYERPNDFS